jgi:glutaredoxin
MLEDAGFTVEERLLTSREQVDRFKEEHGLDTTPLIFIGDEEIGGSEELARYLEAVPQD